MEEKRLEDYTIKEIYMNYPNFEEKYSGIINNTYTLKETEGNDFYAKLKFVKILNQYKKQLDVMPYIHKFSDAIISRILDNVKTVKSVGDIENTTEYNKEHKEFVFNSNAFENIVFNDAILPLTEIALTTYIPENDISKGFQITRAEYIANKAKQMLQGNPEINLSQPTPASIAYNKLIDIFGEENILLLSQNTVEDIAKRLKNRDMHKKSIEFFKDPLSKIIFKYFNKVNDPNISEQDKWDELEFFNETLKSFEKSRDYYNQPATPEADKSINKFTNLLFRTSEIPDYLKTKMTQNIDISIKDVVDKDLEGKYAGLYCAGIREIRLSTRDTDDNIRFKNSLHELVHAATSEMDHRGKPVRIGLRDFRTNMGAGLTEGMTEYIAQKMYSKTDRPKVYVAYPELVSVCQDMMDIYGEETMIDAMTNGPEKLEELMKQDGKSYVEFMGMVDNCFNIIHNDNEKWWEAIKKPEAKASYLKVGEYIESIKRGKGIEGKESEWAKTYDSTFAIFVQKPEEKLTWFQRFKNKIKNIFGFGEEKPLLLNPASTYQEKPEEKNTFIDGIKVDPKIMAAIKQHEEEQRKEKQDKEREDVR